jgi:hypothetical protein
MTTEKEIFDRTLFNRLYYRWFSGVHKKNPELAIELDKKIIPEMGKIMAQRVKENIPGDTSTIDYLINALGKSHWYQEDVEVAEKTENYAVLQTKNCVFQMKWIEKFNEPLYCIASHRPFLEEFCKEINPKSKIEKLVEPTKNPEDDIYCKWKISI